MAVAISLEWSLAAGRKALQCAYHHPLHTTKPQLPFPFISSLFFSCNSRPVRADSSACLPPVLEEPPPAGDAPVIELALKLEDYQIADHTPEEEDYREFNGLICSLFKDSQTQDLAYDYYQKAKRKPGFIPHRITTKLLVRYLIRSKKWSSLLQFCDDLKVFRVLPDKPTCCRLITTCVKARKLKIVDNLLQVVCANNDETAVLAFDYAMKGYNQLHMFSTTVVLYQRMKSAGLDLDPACYYRIMEAYLKLGHYEKAIAVFEDFDSRKMVELVHSSPFYPRIYWILCESLGKLGKVFEALEFFREMQRKGISEDHSHYSSIISSFASSGEVKMAEELVEEAESKKMLRDPALFLKLVLRYIEEGMMEKTIGIVSSMESANIRVSDCIFCAIINGYSKRRGFRTATQVYEDLVRRGCEPGQVTYASVISMYIRLGLYLKAETVFGEMEKKGFHKCVVAYSSMVSAYGKLGKKREAMRLVAKMKERGCEPNIWTYNSLLDMNGKALNLKQVEKTWKEMKRRKIEPDHVSYTSMISAYHRVREFETCVKY